MQKWIILIVTSVIIILSIFIFLNVDIETEYTPETEIEDVELRKTIITLYFEDKETGELVKETKLIDSKELLRNPYEALLKILLEGPQNNNYKNIIPEGTTIINTSFDVGCVTINFSKEFEISSFDEKELNNLVDSILNTLSQLTEVNSIRILVEDNEIEEISDILKKLSPINNNIEELENADTSNNVE